MVAAVNVQLRTIRVRIPMLTQYNRRLFGHVLVQDVQMGASTQPLAVKPAPVGGRSYVNSIATMNLEIPGPAGITIAATVNDVALPLLYLTANQAVP